MLAAWLIVPAAAFGDGILLNPYLGILILLTVGVVVGFVNGLLIVKGRLNGFIVTLGMTILLAGIQDGIVKGQSPFSLPGPFSYLGSARPAASSTWPPERCSTRAGTSPPAGPASRCGCCSPG